jgi:ABC-type antimicrobial peptide transport system permease subunit
MGVAGIVIGLILTYALRDALNARVPGPSLFMVIPIALLLTTLLAAAIPARRASRVDPMAALRHE